MADVVCVCWIGRKETWGTDRHLCPVHKEAPLTYASSMTDGVLTAEARQLIEKWREKADEKLNPGGGRYKHSERTIATLRFCADELEALLSRWRSAHGSREVEGE